MSTLNIVVAVKHHDAQWSTVKHSEAQWSTVQNCWQKMLILSTKYWRYSVCGGVCTVVDPAKQRSGEYAGVCTSMQGYAVHNLKVSKLHTAGCFTSSHLDLWFWTLLKGDTDVLIWTFSSRSPACGGNFYILPPGSLISNLAVENLILMYNVHPFTWPLISALPSRSST